jgi:hypothetical protein
MNFEILEIYSTIQYAAFFFLMQLDYTPSPAQFHNQCSAEHELKSLEGVQSFQTYQPHAHTFVKTLNEQWLP